MFNGAVLVTKNDSIIYKKAFGYANEKTKEKITPESVFYIASVSKQFTAMGIMILKEEGKLSFDDKIKNFFPNYPEYLNSITIRQLLNHTSGLTDREYYQLTNPNNQDVLEVLMKQDSLELKNGETFRYSNSGYVMLALLIEKLSGNSIDQFWNQQIFEPLEMKNTTATKAVVDQIPNKVIGYNLIGEKIDYKSSVMGPGGIYSTLNDLEKWNRAINTNKLVSSKTLDEAFKNGKLNEGPISISMNNQEYGYGFGWMPYVANGKKYVQHDGSVESYRSLIKKNLTDGYDYIFLTNQGGRLAMEELTTSIDLILEKTQYTVPKIPITNKIVMAYRATDIITATTEIKNEVSNNSNNYNIDENSLNRLAYTYFRNDQINIAIEIFKLNTELYSKSSNAFDSLAESYLSNNQLELSKENYLKSLELNPQNTNAKVMLDHIKKQQTVSKN
ncbi:hypothetical protein GCM10010976_04650 [Bizionia arctica]|uniref:Beta-lactamase-related domain-containing protein n=2 Tax=Bizionia arctica TaxID=1495645 RepID=A0A917GBF1_9FLAO|nr:hypothetical protein GCM10010976_04650 [Bizionia arctica]